MGARVINTPKQLREISMLSDAQVIANRHGIELKIDTFDNKPYIEFNGDPGNQDKLFDEIGNLLHTYKDLFE